MKTTRRLTGVLAGAVLVAALLVPGIAHAHADVAASSPADKDKIEAAPAEVWVKFGGFFGETPLTIQNGSLGVFDPCGRPVHTGETTTNTTMDTITVDSGGKYAGTYTIKWSITALDGAAQKGKLTFDVTKGPSCKVRK